MKPVTHCGGHDTWSDRVHIMLVFMAVMFGFLSLSAPAVAQSERDADFQAYCRAKHPNSSHQRTGLTHFCQQPGSTIGQTRHNVDLAEACRMTTGNASFRRLGARILCAAGPGPAPTPREASPWATGGQPVGPPDFARYCRTRFTNSTYLKRTRSWGTEHLCRQPGTATGFVHHNIDMADACRTTRDVSDYRIDGATVTCMRSSETDPEDQRRAGADSKAGPKPGPVPPGPIPPGPKPGPKPGPGPDPDKSFPNKQADIDKRIIKAVCGGMGGKWRPGTPELAKEFVKTMRAVIKLRLTNCSDGPMIPQCIQQIRSEEVASGYMQTLIVWQCSFHTYRIVTSLSGEDRKRVKQEACEIQRDYLEPLQKEANALGVKFQTAPHQKMLARFQLTDMCTASKKIDMAEFTLDQLKKRKAKKDGLKWYLESKTRFMRLYKRLIEDTNLDIEISVLTLLIGYKNQGDVYAERIYNLFNFMRFDNMAEKNPTYTFIRGRNLYYERIPHGDRLEHIHKRSRKLLPE